MTIYFYHTFLLWKFVDTVLVTFVGEIFVIFVDIVFATFVDTLSLAFIISSNTITEVLALILKYLQFSKIQVLGIQL